MTFLFRSRRSAANRRVIDRLNADLVAAVRQPVFYEACGIPDTFSGRFELLVLHAALVVRRLRALGGSGPEVAQALVDEIFRNLDPAMRELGVGDLAVPKRMKRLAEAFLGRSVAYDAALGAADSRQLEEALVRNVAPAANWAAKLAAYVRASVDRLGAAGLDDLLEAALPFPDPAAFLAEDKP